MRYTSNMELKIQNLITRKINFPTRKTRSTSPENWGNDSVEKTLVLEKLDAQIDGKSGDVLVRYKMPSHATKDMLTKKVSINGIYFPKDTDSEIEELLTISDRLKLNGKTVHECSVEELFDAGYIDFSQIKLM